MNGFVQPAAELLHEVADQQRNILAAFAKRRKLNGKNIEAVEKIGTKFAFGDQAAKIGVGGGDHANVHANGAGGAEAFEFMFLQNAKKFRLQFEWDVADFIQENGATVGEFEAANFLRDGAGERTTFMTEEFAFEQAGRDSGTIDFDESAFAARTQIVDGASDELFAGAGFAENEHGGVTWRGEFNLTQSALDDRAFADDLLEIKLAANFFFQIKFFNGEAVLERIDFLEGQSVFDGDGNLCGDAIEEFGVIFGERVEAAAGEIECPESATLTDERHTADRSKAFFAKNADQFGGKLIQLRSMENGGTVTSFPAKRVSEPSKSSA